MPDWLASDGLTLPLCCAVAGVLIPLFWRHHIPMALCVFCAYNALLLKPLAHVLMCTEAAASTTATLYLALNNAAYTVGGLLIPYPMQRPVGAGLQAQAYIIVLWLQLHLALLLPTLYLYFSESRCVHMLPCIFNSCRPLCLQCRTAFAGRAYVHVSLPSTIHCCSQACQCDRSCIEAQGSSSHKRAVAANLVRCFS